MWGGLHVQLRKDVLKAGVDGNGIAYKWHRLAMDRRERQPETRRY